MPGLPEVVLAIGLGLLLLYRQESIPVPWPAAGLALALLLPVWRWRILLLPAAACAAFAWGAWQAQRISHETLPDAAVGQALVITGTIASLPEARGNGTRLLFAPEHMDGPLGSIDFRGLLQLSFDGPAPPELAYGQRWRLTARLQRPQAATNPGGFDRSYALFWQGVRAVGAVQSVPEPVQLAGAGGRVLLRWFQSLRQQVLQASNAALPRAEAGLVQALTVGVQNQLPPDLWQRFVRTGTAHLMVISGSHITLVAGLVFLLAKWLWSTVPPLVRRYPAAPPAAAVMVLSAWGYGLMAGMELATLRAVIMVTVLAGALVLQRELRLFHSLALAAGVIFILQPGAVAEPGFWLSFTAVGLIFWLLVGRVGRAGLWRSLLGYQVLIALGLVPVLALLFGQVPLLSPLANLVAIPVVEGVATPLALLGALASLSGLELAGRGLFHLTSLAFQPLLWFLEQLDRLPWGTLAVGSPSVWMLLALLVGLLLLFLPAAWPGRSLGLLTFLPLLLPAAAVLPPGQARLTVLDAGMDTAVVLQTRHHSLFFHSSPRARPSGATLHLVVQPFMHHAGIRRLDAVVLSAAARAPLDAASLLPRQYPAPQLWSATAALPGAPARPCRAGQHWTWDGVIFVFLAPMAGERDPCVLAAYGPGWQALLGGPLSGGAADRLVSRFGGNLRSNALVSAGGGSGLGQLAEAAAPDYLVAAGGRRGGAEKPAGDDGPPALAPARTGALAFHLGGRTAASLSLQRPARHYWLHQGPVPGRGS
ncbi:MAG: ComEC/Rec2 family competence protein [Pseudomonadota bacterium]